MNRNAAVKRLGDHRVRDLCPAIQLFSPITPGSPYFDVSYPQALALFHLTTITFYASLARLSKSR